MAESVPGQEPEWITVAVAAERVGVVRGRVEQWLREGQLVGRRSDGVLQLPGQFLVPRGETPNGEAVKAGPVKGLPGVITLLRDARFSDEEIVDWLFRPDDSLPGSPVQALNENRGTEVKRRAQVAGY